MADYQLTQTGSQVQNLLNQVTTNANAIGTLSNLNTTTHANLVSAINEVLGLTTSFGTVADHSGSCVIGDLLIQWGSETITPVANSVTTKSMTFPLAYANAPWLGLTLRTTGVGTVKSFGCTSTSTTGSILRMYRENTTDATLGWIAIGKKATV